MLVLNSQPADCTTSTHKLAHNHVILDSLTLHPTQPMLVVNREEKNASGNLGNERRFFPFCAQYRSETSAVRIVAVVQRILFTRHLLICALTVFFAGRRFDYTRKLRFRWSVWLALISWVLRSVRLFVQLLEIAWIVWSVVRPSQHPPGMRVWLWFTVKKERRKRVCSLEMSSQKSTAVVSSWYLSFARCADYK